jgi:hypothetical protein
MKKAAAHSQGRVASIVTPLMMRRQSSYFGHRDWDRVYQGLPNATIEAVKIKGSYGIVRIRQENGDTAEHSIGGLKYLVGRRGSLSYLDPKLRIELFQDPESNKEVSNISGNTLRLKVEVDTEIAPSVFIIGSLTGDSLVRYSFGSSVYAASKILGISTRNR